MALLDIRFADLPEHEATSLQELRDAKERLTARSTRTRRNRPS